MLNNLLSPHSPHRPHIQQFIKYAVVGLSINAILYFAYLGLEYVLNAPKMAATTTYFCGIILSYNGHKKLVFKDTSRRAYKKMIKFFILYLSGYLINMAGLYLLVDKAKFPHEIVQAGLIILIAVYLFINQKLWIFKQSIPSQDTQKHSKQNLYWYLFYGLVWLITCIPIIANEYVMMVDYINHLSRQFVRFEYSNIAAFQDFYSYQWMLIPNLANDLIITALLPFTDIYQAGRIMLCFMLGLWIFAPVVMQHLIHQKINALPLIGALTAYNAMFFWGFTGTMLTAPLAFIVFALWVYCDKKDLKVAYKIPVFIALSFMIYVGHLLIFMLLGMLVGLYELQKWLQNKPYKISLLLKNMSVIAVSFSLGISHFIYHLLTKNIDHGQAKTEWYFANIELWKTLSPNLDIVSTLSAFVIILILVDGLITNKIFKFKNPSFCSLPILCLGIGIFAIPSVLLGVYLIDIRIPALFVLFVVGLCAFKLQHKHKIILTSFISCLLIAQSLSLTVQWKNYNKDIQSFTALTSQLPKAQKFITLYSKDFFESHPQTHKYYWHIASYLTINKHAYTPSTFTGMGAFFEVSDKYKHLDAPQPSPLNVEYFIAVNEQKISPLEGHDYIINAFKNYDYILIIGHSTMDSYFSDKVTVTAQNEFGKLLKISKLEK